MSRIGFKPIALPAGVTVVVKDNVATVKGPKGEVSVHIPADVSVAVADGVAHVKPASVSEDEGAQGQENHGTTAANLRNAIKGVSEGWKKELVINGTGFRAALKGKTLSMFLGYTNEVVVEPIGAFTKIVVVDETHVNVEGVDKQQVGQTAALIYDSHRPDVYANKGVHYVGQHLIKKIGKRAAATTTGASGAAPAKK